MAPALEDEIDGLYGLPFEEFTAARDELAKRLRREGDRAAADRVRKLRKPVVAAWAVNQLSRARRDELDALLRAGDELRAAQEEVLGGGGRERMRAAVEAERAAIDVLVAAARELLPPRSGEATLEAVRETLRAAATDDEVREEVVAGRLVRERTAAGLGFAGALAASVEPARERGPAAEGEAVKPAKGEAKPAKREARPAKGKARAAKAKAKAGGGDAPERRAADGERRRAEAEEEAQRRAEEERLRSARDKLERGRKELAAAERRMSKVQAERDRAQEALEQVQARLADRERALAEARAAAEEARTQVERCAAVVAELSP